MIRIQSFCLQHSRDKIEHDKQSRKENWVQEIIKYPMLSYSVIYLVWVAWSVADSQDRSPSVGGRTRPVPWKPYRDEETHIIVRQKLTSSVVDPDPGSGAFLTPRSGAFLTPGSGMGKKIRIRIREEQSGSYFWELRKICWVKIIKFDPGCKKIRIRDKHPGSTTRLTFMFSIEHQF